MKILDMMGQPCPIPVVNAKKSLAEQNTTGVIVLVDNMGELEFGALQEQDPSWFIGSDALRDLWKGPTRVFLLSDVRDIEELASLLGKGNIIEAGRTHYDVVLSNF